MPYASLARLDSAQRKETLAKLVAIYHKAPTTEHFFLVAFVLWRALEGWAKTYKSVVLPSALLGRLESGLQRKKRYLGLWITRQPKAKLKRFILTQEALAITALWFRDAQNHQAPSDPFRLKTLITAISSLGAKDREIIAWLCQDKTDQEIAALRKITYDAARQQVARARAALRGKLPKDFLK